MKLFEAVKDGVTVRQAAERCGLSVTRNGMTCCLFHDDRHPSMKLNEDYYYCFGCGAHGDVVDLVARLEDCSPIEAARFLAGEFGISEDRGPLPRRRPAPDPAQNAEQTCLSTLLDYLHLLEDWQERYAPQSIEDTFHDHYVEACQMYDRVAYLADVLLAGGTEECAAAVRMLTANGAMEALRERTARMREEESHDRAG